MARYAFLEGEISAWTVSRSALFNGREKSTSGAVTSALKLLLDSMSVGEFKLLNDTTYNLLTSPTTDVYTRAYYDAEYISSGGVSSNFASDAAVKTYVTGSYNTDDQGRPLYSGMAYNKTTNLIFQFGGGHSNGAMNHALAFDVSAAGQSKYIGGAGGRWQVYTDPAPLSGVDSDNDQAERIASWPALTKGTPFDLRYPQVIATGTIGPNGNVAPYSLHTYSAVVHDPVNGRYWVGGGSVGNTGEGGVGPRGMWYLNDTTRAWTAYFSAHTGSNAAGYLMAPDGTSKFLYYSHGTNDQHWSALDISAMTVTQTSNGGETVPPGAGAAPMWVQDLTTVGHYDIIRQCYPGNNLRFMAYRAQWSAASGVPTSAQTNVLYPTGSAGVYYTGASPKWDQHSGFVYSPDDRKIYAFCEKSADSHTGFVIQMIDPFVGGTTSAAQWDVTAFAAGTYSGDVPTGPYSANHEFRTGWNNKVVDLGPAYGAFVLFLNPARGDVILVKRAART